jgi:16S rRNA (uracil1498-N3)-methyltransferase
MARRFIIDRKIEENEEFIISGEEAKHILVLRNNIGDIIEVNDKKCKILDINKQNIRCRSIENAEIKGVPNVKITLYQALLKSDKMEYVIQKSVELGASRIIPFSSKNVVVKLEEKDKIKKVERFNKISREASKQCGRSDIVQVENIKTFNDLLGEVKNYKKCIIAYENETNSLKELIRENIGLDEVAVIIGAEGGFDKKEVEQLIENGCVSISLGDRILRAETASLNLISILMYELN